MMDQRFRYESPESDKANSVNAPTAEQPTPDQRTTHLPTTILRLQRTVGNQATMRAINHPQYRTTQRQPPTVQRAPAGTYEWLGQIQNTDSAALRKNPHKDAANPHDGTIADLPHDTPVRVLGKKKGWLHVEVDLEGKTLTGYVSHELVKYVRDGKFDFSADEVDIIKVMTVENAFLTLKRAETSKAKDPKYKPDTTQAEDIQAAIDKLKETEKYVVDPLTYQVTFRRQLGEQIRIQTIEDFILFVETVERQYPTANPNEVAGEIRQLWFSDQNWDVMVNGQGVVSGGKAEDIETKPNPIAEMFDMKDLAPQKGGKQLSTHLGAVDIGHVMAGIDSALNGAPAKVPDKFRKKIMGTEYDDPDAALKYRTLKNLDAGDPRDFATWSGDLGQAYAEYLVARWVKDDASASLKTFVADKSPKDQLLGDIHGYIAYEVWKKVPASISPTGQEKKVSNILRDMYLVTKEKSGIKDSSYQKFMEITSGQTGDNLKEFIIKRVLAFGQPWYAKKAYDERGWRRSKGWTGEGILENGMNEFLEVHAKNDVQAAVENRLDGLIQSFFKMLKDTMP